MDIQPITRRNALVGVAGAGVGLPLLAACGSGSGDAGAGDGGSGSSAPADSPSAKPAAGATLVATSDVPVGGGVVLADQKVVVTQPTAGDYRAFSAVCTHQGCLVATVADGLIECPCHLSEFKIADGSPASGPATAPLEAVKIDVSGGEISLA